MRAALKKTPTEKSLLVAIDEIQKLPSLLDEVHLLIEEFKGKICFIFTGSSARKLMRSYLSTYLKEEVLEESLVRKIERFVRFLNLAGQLNGEPINHSKLGKTLKTTSNTVQEYFSILVDTVICHRSNFYKRLNITGLIVAY